MSEEILFRHREKRKVFEEFMKDDHALVHLDTRVAGVIVPRVHGGKYNLTLKLSYLFQGETKVDDEGVSTYLKFDGNYQECVMPWAAIWGITSSKSQTRVWQDDLPKEVALEVAGRNLNESATKLSSVKPEAIPEIADSSDDDPPPLEPGKKGKTVPFLRRIK